MADMVHEEQSSFMRVGDNVKYCRDTADTYCISSVIFFYLHVLLLKYTFTYIYLVSEIISHMRTTIWRDFEIMMK